MPPNSAIVVLLAFLAIALAAAAAVLLASRAALLGELARMAAALEACRPASADRVTVSYRAPVALRLARAANALLDDAANLQARELASQRAFQEDLAALSHDIRTPLAGAQGYLELHTLEQDPVRRAAHLASAQERLQTVRTLVDDLFEYTKALAPAPATNQGSEAPQSSVRLKPLVDQALLAQYPAFAGRGWEPVVDFADDSFELQVPPETLERILANLVANCLRHGSTAPAVTQRGTCLAFSNEVPNPQLIDPDRLFERFYRADAARQSPGAGLGLAIVARLCAQIGAAPSAHLDGPTLHVSIDFASNPLG